LPTLAFWNIAGNVAPATVAAFAHESDADILILAENEIPKEWLVLALNSRVNRYYFPDPGPSGRLTIFTRFLADPSTLVSDYGRVSIREYRMPIGGSFLVVAVHLSSKLRMKTEDQIFESVRVAAFIREAEGRVGHQRTIVIGDLNMNPFEAGVIGSSGFHAIVDRAIASGGSRLVAGEVCSFFYNPMWSFFGDRGSAPPGTYFYNSGRAVNYYWNIFDQVLVRPSLLKFLDRDAVSIVTAIGGQRLLTGAGRPDKKIHSDHLPLVCRLSLLEELVNG
jgi:Endonuclease/Exonuclease/phosphatase family